MDESSWATSFLGGHFGLEKKKKKTNSLQQSQFVYVYVFFIFLNKSELQSDPVNPYPLN